MLSFSLLLALAAGAAPLRPPPAGYALIVTNNRSLEASRPDLHYADDDGAKYAQLFTESLGLEHVTLLTQFDSESAQLFPEWAKVAKLPSRANLEAAVRKLAVALDRDRLEGRETEAYFIFAGHGDIERGEGYVDLLDQKLKARDLEELVIRPLHATHLHLILDSCNSYFMLSPRKPGGRRWEVNTSAQANVLARYPTVGALVSTSAEAVTYEWSEVQSGIFSYEVRSGLRGAADVNGDGYVSYEELAAFITSANSRVPNDLYRPKVFMGAPGNNLSLPVWALPTAGRVMNVPAGSERRLTVRDGHGVRVLDVHKEAEASLRLNLPTTITLTVEEALPATVPGGRPTARERQIDEGNSLLAASEATFPAVARRGEAPIFASLFASPFGEKAFAEQKKSRAESMQAPSGVSLQDLERLKLHLEEAAESAGQVKFEHAFGYAFEGTFLITVSTVGLVKSDNHGLFYLGAAEALLWGGLGTFFTLISDPGERKLYSDFSEMDVSTEQLRSQTVTAFELRLRALAQAEARSRKGWGIAQVITAAVTGSVGFALFSNNDESVRGIAPLFVTTAGIFLVHGIWNLALRRGAAEIGWKAYRKEPEFQNSARSTEQEFEVTIGPTFSKNGAGLAFAGQF